MANLLGTVLLGIALVACVRHGRRRATLLGAGLVVGGWAGNLLDRLGGHRWSAPGSPRGAVDFIPTGMGYRGNVADLFIAGGTVLLAGSLVTSRQRGRRVSPAR